MRRSLGRIQQKRLIPPIPMAGTEKQIAWAREIYRRLLKDSVRVRENSDVLALLTDKMDGPTLAEWYLNHVARHHRRATWWINHRDELTASWFMHEYMERYLKTEKETENLSTIMSAVWKEALISPENPMFPGAVELMLERETGECGWCILRYEKNETFGKLVRELDMKWNAVSGGYVRRIEPPFTPLVDCCAEIGSRLLLAGFRLLAMDEEVRIRLSTGAFEWGYEKWVLPGSSPSRLRLYFPENRALFQRARTMGAFWNGRAVEIAAWHEEEVRDFARLYGFAISSEAERRMEQWREERLKGKTVRPKQRRMKEEWTDPVQSILLKDAEVLEELIDED